MITKDMRGRLGPNKNKTSDKHPNLKGSITIEGREYWLSGWVNHNDDGTKWISLTAEAKVEKEAV